MTSDETVKLVVQSVDGRVVEGRDLEGQPDFAKSAGTLPALAADEIVMSDTSELGPIDPQVVRRTSTGAITTAVQHHLDAHRQAKEALQKDPTDVVAATEFSSFDPATIVSYEAVVDRARSPTNTFSKACSVEVRAAPTPGSLLNCWTPTDGDPTGKSSIGVRQVRSDSMSPTRNQITLNGVNGGACTACNGSVLDREVTRLFESDPVFLSY